ncbi:MAG: HD domain-containing protein [Desulfovibrionaceae bacterium]|nr:HD domain-containing protein [Desulfovibrionaceae bacterium]
MANDADRMTSPSSSDKRCPGDFPGRLPTAHPPPAGPPARKAQDIPLLAMPHAPMEMFDPDRHVCLPTAGHSGFSGAVEPLPLAAAARLYPELLLIPRRQDCDALWDRYAMLDNIRAHSEQVAGMAYALALRAKDLGLDIYPEAVLAAGLLHDLAKTYTIHYGGNHAQLGAAWVMRETGNGPIAQAVLAHVFWPWAEDADNDDSFMLLALAYADKRVMHDRYVPLEERFEDLLVRYGVNDYARSRIESSFRQGKRIEEALSRRLGVGLNEYTADSGRLVKRT